MQDPGPVDGPQAGDGLVLQGVEAAPVGIAFADSSLRLLYANDAFRAAAGIEVGSALGAYPNESGALAEAAQGVLGMHAGSELELVGASGERSLVALLFPLEGRRVGIVLTDASDRAALRESEERFAAFMDNAPSISFMVDDADRAV
jgi:PAS domain-containing protein